MKQGVRDLNYYGPRGREGGPGAPGAATGADGKVGPEARPVVISAIGPHDEGAVK